MTDQHSVETGAFTDEQVSVLEHSLAVVLARVRCKLIHAQTNDGRCVSCISWANRVGVPRHLPTLARFTASAKSEGAES